MDACQFYVGQPSSFTARPDLGASLPPCVPPTASRFVHSAKDKCDVSRNCTRNDLSTKRHRGVGGGGCASRRACFGCRSRRSYWVSQEQGQRVGGGANWCDHAGRSPEAPAALHLEPSNLFVLESLRVVFIASCFIVSHNRWLYKRSQRCMIWPIPRRMRPRRAPLPLVVSRCFG